MQQTFNINNDNYLRKMALKGFKKRHLSGKEYEDRLRMELDIITDANLSDFFLNTSYICNLLKSEGMFLGPGRGSAGGSLLCYCLNIVSTDPLKEGLMFSRFINKTRIKNSMPDIDTDIPKTRRQEALDLIKDKFGRDCAFSIPNLIRFTIKTSIKDVSRVFNVPFKEVNQVTSLITDDMTVDDIYEIEKVQNFFNKYPKVEQNFKKINGLIKAYGIHAGGTLLFPDSIENYSSTIRVNGVDCVSYDGHRCDSLKFLKNDTLGLNTLSIIEDTIKLINDDNFKLPTEYEDKKVYDTILKNPLNIFQLETPSASSYIKKMKPDCFNDLIAALALVRPGSQDSGDADRYIARKFGEEEIKYDDPRLEPILKETKGAIVYQEQAMKICMVLAGLTDVDADNIRKGIGKKLDYIFTEYKPKFINGCINNNVSKQTAELIWDKIEKSSSYSFNKAHAKNYAVISYYTGYLKTYYPAEFSVACLNHTKDDEKKNKILSEIKNMDLVLHNPDINISQRDTIFMGRNIYMGLSTIDKVGDKAIEEILLHQPYFSFDLFLQKRRPRKVNKSVVNNLIYAGAFDRFGDRNKIYNTFNKDKVDEKWSDKDKLKYEYAVLKFSPHEELINKYETEYDRYITDINDIDPNIDIDELYIKGICIDIDNKKGYSIIHIQDRGNNISVSVNQNVLNRYIDYLKVGEPYIVKCHTWKGKFYAHFFINLEMDKEIFINEYQYINNSYMTIIKNLNEHQAKYAVVKKITYFKSKKGNDCLRIDAYDGKNVVIMSCSNAYNNIEKNIVASDYIEFAFSKRPFANVKKNDKLNGDIHEVIQK